MTDIFHVSLALHGPCFCAAAEPVALAYAEQERTRVCISGTTCAQVVVANVWFWRVHPRRRFMC
eukprot:1131606-Rhodomonas_salina.1